MPNSTELQRQTIIQLVGRLLNLFLGLGAVAIMTRALGLAGFGEYTTIIAFLQFVALISGFGLGMTIGRELGRDEKNQSNFLGQAIGFRVTTAAVIFAAAPLVAATLGYQPFIVRGIALASLGFFANSLTAALVGVLQAKLKSATLVYVDLLGKLTLLLGVAWAAYANLSVTGYLAVFVAANLLACLAMLLATRRLVSFRISFNPQAWAAIWRITWPIALTTTLNVIYFKADTVILSLLRPAEDVALYGAAYNVLEVLLAVPAIIGGLVLPLLARARAQGNQAGANKLYAGSFDALLAAGLAILVGMLFVGKPVMTIVAGANFATSGQILAILSLAILCSFLGNAAGYALFALDKQRQLIPVFGLGAAVGLAAYFILIPLYSYWGAAWGTVIVELLVNAAMITMLWRFGLKPSADRWPKIILATLALALGLALPGPLLVKIIAGGALWSGALWYLKLMPTRSQLIEL